MMDTDLIATDRQSEARAPLQRSGFLYNWGPQAWIDMWMSNTMLVRKAMPIISHTFLPILRLSTNDREQLESDYREIRARREVIARFDSPREKWRKRYGNFVREIEWALLELRKHYSQAQYEDIVIGTSVALSHETSADFLAMMNSMAEKNRRAPRKATASTKPGWFTRLTFAMFNPAGWLTGPAQITEFDAGGGRVTIEIPECAWHVCARRDSLPDPQALPSEGCLNICKGPFERLFSGANGGLRMQFEPHLPKTACTVRMDWKSG